MFYVFLFLSRLTKSALKFMKVRVTSLEQLSVAEFSDEYAKPKAYENDHRKVLGIWFYVVLKVKL